MYLRNGKRSLRDEKGEPRGGNQKRQGDLSAGPSGLASLPGPSAPMSTAPRVDSPPPVGVRAFPPVRKDSTLSSGPRRQGTEAGEGSGRGSSRKGRVWGRGPRWPDLTEPPTDLFPRCHVI